MIERSFPLLLPTSPVACFFPKLHWNPVILDKFNLSEAEKSLLRTVIDKIESNSKRKSTKVSTSHNKEGLITKNNDDSYYHEANGNDLLVDIDCCAYVRILLKMLDEATTSSPNSEGELNNERAKRVCNLTEEELCLLPDSDALNIVYSDSNGVITHFCVTKLFELLTTLSLMSSRRNRNSMNNNHILDDENNVKNDPVTIFSTFYCEKRSEGDNNDDNDYEFNNLMMSQDLQPLWRLVQQHITRKSNMSNDDNVPVDFYAQRVACLCLSCIIIAACPSQEDQKFLRQKRRQKYHEEVLVPSFVEELLNHLMACLVYHLDKEGRTSLSLVMPSVITIMDCREARLAFVEHGGIGLISRLLRVRQVAPEVVQFNKIDKIEPQKKQQQHNEYFNPHLHKMIRLCANNDNDNNYALSVQQLYELSYCLWCISLDCKNSTFIRNNFAKHGTIIALTDMIIVAPREKVVRVALATLRNLSTLEEGNIDNNNEMLSSLTGSSNVTDRSDNNIFVAEMINCGLMKHIEFMNKNSLVYSKDLDIIDDIKVLYRILHKNYDFAMTCWDAYKTEVETGCLEWGLVHTTKFFKENIKQFEGNDNNFDLIRKLLNILRVNQACVARQKTTDSIVNLIQHKTDESAANCSNNDSNLGTITSNNSNTVISIAMHDIGEFVRYYPNGRSLIKSLGGKEIVMNIMATNKDKEVQRHALICLSKIMIKHCDDVKI